MNISPYEPIFYFLQYQLHSIYNYNSIGDSFEAANRASNFVYSHCSL